MKKQTFEQVTITPREAERLLKRNRVNRPVSSGTVKAYAEDMKNGRWDTNTTSCIAFNTRGDLVDGQHRLNAIILSGVPTLMWVSYNVGDNVVFDSGRNRSLSDFMKISHPDLEPIYHNNTVLAVVRYLILSSRTGSLERRGRVTQHECEDFIFEHKHDLDTYYSKINGGIKVSKVTISLVHLTMFMAYKGGVSLDDLSHFFNVLTSGFSEEGSRDFPIIAYRKYLVERDDTAPVTIEEIKKCQGAIKKFLTNSGLKRVYIPKDLIWDFPYRVNEEE